MAEEPKSETPASVEDPRPETVATTDAEDSAGLETTIELEELGPCKRLLKVSVPAEKVIEEVEKGYKEIGSELVYPGFRKGHVPRPILEKRFGTQIRDEVKEGLLQSSYEEAVTDKKLSPLGQPKFDKVEFEWDKPLSFEVTLNIRPEFELGTYKGIEVEEPVLVPTEEEIDSAIQRVLQGRAELVTAEDGVAKEGDYLIADVAIHVGEEKVRFEEETSVAVGSDQVLGVKDPKIRDLFIGAKVDEDRTVEVELGDTFPEKEHRGKQAKISVSPKEVKRARIPELDDTLAKDLGFDSAAEVRQDVTRRVAERKEMEKNPQIESAILGKILETIDLPLPEDIIESETDNVEARRSWRLQQMGLGEKEIQDFHREGRSKSKEEIGRSLREIFLLDKVAEAEKLFVTEDEVDQHLTAYAAERGVVLQALKDELRDSG
ncbi:MAG: trigger factor [Planctomycetota bacterium]|nr:trigger factor [Planctomycetota bacterium]